jgi:hypothetical protein
VLVRLEKTESLHTVGKNVINAAIMGNCGRFSKTLKIECPFDLAVLFLVYIQSK